METSIDLAPNIEEQVIEISVRARPRLSPDSSWILHARYLNPERTKIRTVFRMSDGRISEAEVGLDQERSPLLRDIRAQLTDDQILLATKQHEELFAYKQNLDMRMAEDRRATQELESTAAAKAQALEIEEVRIHASQELKRKIRRASSTTEVSVWTAVALMEIRSSLASPQ